MRVVTLFNKQYKWPNVAFLTLCIHFKRALAEVCSKNSSQFTSTEALKEFHQFNFERYSALKFFPELFKSVVICSYLGLTSDGDIRRVTRMQYIYINPYPTAFPYGNGMVLHFYQQQESSTTKTVHKVINKGLKTYI